MEMKIPKTEYFNYERMRMAVDSEIEIYEEPYSEEVKVVTDDGNLHITAYGMRYCIMIGQDVTKRFFLAECHRALRAMKITGVSDDNLITGR